MLVQDIIYRARAVLDEYNVKGVVIPPQDTAEIDKNALFFVDMSVKEVYKLLRIKKSFAINQVPTSEQVALGDWLSTTLPTDFGQLTEIVDSKRLRFDAFDLIEWRTLFLPPQELKLTVYYYALPTTITSLNEDVELYNPHAENFLVYSTASKIAVAENPSLVTFLEQKALELRAEAVKGQPAVQQQIINVYGG